MDKYHRLIGKNFLYLGGEVVVKKIECMEGDLLKVTTDKKIIRIRESELRKELLPIESEIERHEGIMLYRGVQVESGEMTKLSDALMENIKKVQENKEFIDQARSINESAKAIIELKKAQIQMIKLMKGL